MMVAFLRPRGAFSYWQPMAAAMLLALFAFRSAARADVVFTGDPAYPLDAVVFTVDPEGKGTAQRGIAATRNLRQTFQVPITFDVAQIVLGINVDNAAPTAGMQIRIYEVADVMSGWAPGNLVKQFVFPTLPAELGPASTLRMGLALSDADIFTLPVRNSGTQGYGIEISNNDGVSTLGQLRHTNDGTDYYPGGQYYSETSAFATRDIGLALAATPGGGLIPGDVDGDGVGGEFPDDFNPIKMNFRKMVTQRAQGDLVPNGTVDFADFREWKTAHVAAGGSLADIDLSFTTGVPEPATWLLVAIACGALASRRHAR